MLVVRQILKSGYSRQWRLKEAPEPKSFGVSRSANLISIDPNHQGIEACLRYQNGIWFWNELKVEGTETPIDKETTLYLGDSTLILTPVKKQTGLLKAENLTQHSKGKTEVCL
ncbi:MAG: hypothetical protein N2578_08835, partial [Bdellovibrionaceae bacterium]|nr:hypothetical protein [Pseudobdellovibrionaceae bacterium]